MRGNKIRRLFSRAERFDSWGFHKEARDILYRLARDYVVETISTPKNEETKGE